MKKWLISLICIVFSFLFCFVCVGYAQVSDELLIAGEVAVSRAAGIYITDVMPANGLLRSTYTKNVLTSTVALVSGQSTTTTQTSNQGSAGTRTTTTVDYNGNATVSTATTTRVNWRQYNITTVSTPVQALTTTVTFYNHANYTYYFNRISYSEEFYDNASIRCRAVVSEYAESDTLREGSFKPGETMKLDLTFYLSENNVTAIENLDLWLDSTIEFQFDLTKESQSEIEGEVISGVFDQSLKILNTPESYNELVTAITENWDGNTGRYWTGTYIGNVSGSDSEDTEIILDLFEGNLKLNIDSSPVEVTTMIKMENIDGQIETGVDCTLKRANGSVAYTYSGCEITLYMTIADLSSTTPNTKAEPIYAVVFERGDDGVWYQLGGMYKGEAEVVGYEGGYTGGSFDTGSWRSVEPYTFGNSVVPTGTSIGNLIQSYIDVYGYTTATEETSVSFGG